MNQDDAQVKIGAYIDPSGATEGARQVVQDVDKIGNAAGDAGPKFSKMVEEAGGMRESQRLARELFEAMRGGDESIAGLSGILRYALISSEALGPLGPIAPAITALGLGFVAAWAMHQKGSEDSKNKVEGDLDETGTAVQTFARNYVDALKDVLTAQKHIEQSDKNQVDFLKEKQRLTTEQIKLDEQVAIQKARQDYLAANANTTSDAERKRLKEQFDAEVDDIKGESTVETSQKNLEFKNEDIAQAEKNLEDLKSTQSDIVRRLNEAQDARAKGGNYLENLGIKIDDKGVLTGKDGTNAIDSAQKQADETSHVLQGLMSQLAAEARIHAQHEDDRSDADFQASQKRGADQVKQLSDQWDAEDLALAQLRNARNDVMGYKDAQEKFGGAIKDDDQKISSQESALVALKEAIPQLTQALSLASLTLQNDQKQRQQEDDLAEQQAANEKAFTDRHAEREKELSDIDAQLKAAEDEATKTSLEKQRADIQAEDITDKAGYDLSTGKIDSAQYQTEVEKAKNTRGNANTEAQHQDDSASQKALEDRIHELEGQIRATGDKGAVGAMTKLLETVKDKLLEQAGLTNILAQAHAGLSQKVDRIHADTQQHLDRITGGN